MNYKSARQIVIGLVAISALTMGLLYFFTSPVITIEYFAIHMIIVLAGLRWLRKKKLGL